MNVDNMKNTIGIISMILLSFLSGSFGQDPDCSFYQHVHPRQTYYVYSPDNPNYYPPNKNCRWQVQCPESSHCKLNCPQINIPYTTSCVDDRLLVSTTGDLMLNNAERYCGQGTMDVMSIDRSLTIGFVSVSTSSGGIFSCTLTSYCECGFKFQSRIVGGQETGVNEYPMMVGLVDLSIMKVYCGATIISQRWVISAAHCFDSLTANNIGILYGAHSSNQNESPGTTIRAIQAIKHPLYITNGDDYDISLVMSDVDIVYSDRVGPVCLPYKFVGNSLDGMKVQALGWGHVDIGVAGPPYLQKVELEIISQSSCQRQGSSIITDRIVCTHTVGKDTCQEDSGGPLLYEDPNGRVYLMGIINGGYGCHGSVPNLNARVTEYLEWISITTGSFYCDF